MKAAKDNISLFKFPFGGNWRVFESDYNIVPRIKDGNDKFVSQNDVLGLETLLN